MEDSSSAADDGVGRGRPGETDPWGQLGPEGIHKTPGDALRASLRHPVQIVAYADYFRADICRGQRLTSQRVPRHGVWTRVSSGRAVRLIQYDACRSAGIPKRRLEVVGCVIGLIRRRQL